MIRPRPLPPTHKNQLSVPVKSIGFYAQSEKPNSTKNQPQRHSEVVRKKVWRKNTNFLPSIKHSNEPKTSQKFKMDRPIEKEKDTDQNEEMEDRQLEVSIYTYFF